MDLRYVITLNRKAFDPRRLIFQSPTKHIHGRSYVARKLCTELKDTRLMSKHGQSTMYPLVLHDQLTDT